MNQIKSDKNRLSERQVKALPFFISTPSDKEGCRQAKIAPQTFYEWLKEPAFKAELSRLRNMIVDDAVESLKAHTTRAVDTLVKLLDTGNPSLQRSVANDIIQHVIKFKECQEIERRIQALENTTASNAK